MSLTAAPRSSVVHLISSDPAMGSSSFTACGRRIGDEWAGEYTAAPEGPANCSRCITREAAAQTALEASARYKVGQRVGILTGFQSVSGAWVADHGTVTAVRSGWNGKPSFLVRADGEAESFVYEPWMLQEVAAPSVDETRDLAASMERHPAGKAIPRAGGLSTMRAVRQGNQSGALVLFRNGFRVRRDHYVTPLLRVIMAVRMGDPGQREYVVAVHHVGASEWTNGQYTSDMIHADRLFSARVDSF